MSHRFVLTPFFLDEFQGGLLPVAGACWDVNMPELPAGDAQSRIVSLLRPLRSRVAEAAAAGAVPVSLAGDCVSCIGVEAGLQTAGLEPVLVWLDAHGDFNTPSTTPSGFLGGMPLAMIVGRGDQAIMEGVGTTTLDERDVILSDARDLDPGERGALAGSNVNHLASFDELLTLPLPDRPLHVHFDTDVIDPEQAPAMNYPAPGGPSADTVRAVFRRLAQSGRVAAVSVSSWNPDLDQDGRTRRLVMDLLSELAPEPPESTS